VCVRVCVSEANKYSQSVMSIQLHVASFIGHARQRHDVIGCSDSRPVSAQRLLIPMRVAAVYNGVSGVQGPNLQLSYDNLTTVLR